MKGRKVKNDMVKQQLNDDAIAKTLATVVGGWYVLCAAVLYLIPSTTLSVGKILFHGVQLTAMTADLMSVIIGLVLWVALAWAAGMVFAKLYNQWAA